MNWRTRNGAQLVADEKNFKSLMNPNEAPLYLLHELRRHILALSSGIDLLNLHDESKDRDPQTVEILDRMKNEISLLDQFCAEYFGYSIINRKILAPSNDVTDLNLIVDNVCKRWAPTAKKSFRELYWKISKKPLMNSWDIHAIDRCLSNIIENSLKFTEPKLGKISIEVSTRGQRALIKVQDNGIGISKHEMKSIFRMGERGENVFRHSEQPSGTGIGLKLAKDILEPLGGLLLVDSVENVGTKVRIVLPLSNPH